MYIAVARQGAAFCELFLKTYPGDATGDDGDRGGKCATGGGVAGERLNWCEIGARHQLWVVMMWWRRG